ncbi:MAG TPA: PfkB family carbohydrate kinase [Dongiaceae bacterium]
MTPAPFVIVVGNCTVDLSFAVPRFPKAGETLLALERHVDLGGKGANQAMVAHRFGIETLLAAPIGRDAEGDWACAQLAAEGLPPAGIQRTDTATDQSIIYVTPDGENSIVSSHRAAAQATADWATAVIAAAPAGAHLLMQGNLSLATTCAALGAARARGLPTIMNPAPIQYAYDKVFPLTDLVVLNEIEAVELGRRSDPIAAGQAIQDGGVATVIVTLGADGAVLIAGEAPIRFPAPRVAAVDSVGAGDVFCGALAACHARDMAIATAIQIAIEAASLAVTRRGTQASFPSAAEAAAILLRHRIQR